MPDLRPPAPLAEPLPLEALGDGVVRSEPENDSDAPAADNSEPGSGTGPDSSSGGSSTSKSSSSSSSEASPSTLELWLETLPKSVKFENWTFYRHIKRPAGRPPHARYEVTCRGCDHERCGRRRNCAAGGDLAFGRLGPIVFLLAWLRGGPACESKEMHSRFQPGAEEMHSAHEALLAAGVVL